MESGAEEKRHPAGGASPQDGVHVSLVHLGNFRTFLFRTLLTWRLFMWFHATLEYYQRPLVFDNGIAAPICFVSIRPSEAFSQVTHGTQMHPGPNRTSGRYRSRQTHTKKDTQRTFTLFTFRHDDKMHKRTRTGGWRWNPGPPCYPPIHLINK